MINAQGNNEAHIPESGTALLIAAAPAGKGCLIDAASVLPTLAAVPPSVLTGTAAATVVELADPLDPQAVLTRLRTIAAQPGPLHVYVAGQLHLDQRQRLLHLALARTTPSTLRYTALPWHWLTGELTRRRQHTTTVVVDLVADAEAWRHVSAGGLGLGHGTALFGRVAPAPPRRAVHTPTYLRAYADIWRTGSRPTPPQLHDLAATHAGPPQALFVSLPSGHTPPPSAGTPSGEAASDGGPSPSPSPSPSPGPVSAAGPDWVVSGPVPGEGAGPVAETTAGPVPSSSPGPVSSSGSVSGSAASPVSGSVSGSVPSPASSPVLTKGPAAVPAVDANPAPAPAPVAGTTPVSGPAVGATSAPAPGVGSIPASPPRVGSTSAVASVAAPISVAYPAPASDSAAGERSALPADSDREANHPAPLAGAAAPVTAVRNAEPAAPTELPTPTRPAADPGTPPAPAQPAAPALAPSSTAPAAPSAPANSPATTPAPPATRPAPPAAAPPVAASQVPPTEPTAHENRTATVPAPPAAPPAPPHPAPARRAEAAIPARPTTPPGGADPHAVILAAVREGRHGEAADLAATWESQALRAHGMRSAEVVHWMEVRADLARLADEPGRSCELWIGVAHARIARGESPSDEDVEAAVDRAHHQWEQVDDPARARGHAAALVALREQVPGRRPGALDAIKRRLDALSATPPRR
ncbi:hypothetical protein [Streptomyces sp. WG-D5]